jgi:adenosylcobyric acid synthase
MGRAQVVQAEAAGVEPDVRMNPILLKPTTDKKAQVIVNGKVYNNMSAAEYNAFKPDLKNMVEEIYGSLASENDIVVIEGAGSPAEINLMDRDIVNMGMAEIAGAPVLLVGDIDRGGVFASLAGTMLLLPEQDKKRVKGVIINKFRGDLEILKPGIKMIENIINVPVIGVIPHAKFSIDDEDSVSDKLSSKQKESTQEIDIAVIHVPHISNYTDFNSLENMPGVGVRYVKDTLKLGIPDLVIIPGTKNTIGDLLYLRETGMEEAIKLLYKKGVPIFGICGGFQMLGSKIYDKHFIESNMNEIDGMGLLNITTNIEKEKNMKQVEARINLDRGIFEGTKGLNVKGYEIHMGTTEIINGCLPLSVVLNGNRAADTEQYDGACSIDGCVAGTYIHGIFDNSSFSLKLINNLRLKKGLVLINSKAPEHHTFKQAEYDKLAELLREHLDIEKVYSILKKEQ